MIEYNSLLDLENNINALSIINSIFSKYRLSQIKEFSKYLESNYKISYNVAIDPNTFASVINGIVFSKDNTEYVFTEIKTIVRKTEHAVSFKKEAMDYQSVVEFSKQGIKISFGMTDSYRVSEWFPAHVIYNFFINEKIDEGTLVEHTYVISENTIL